MKRFAPLLRPVIGAALGALGIFLLTAAPSPPAKAQGISFIRDTEAERVLRNWLDPILVAAELNPQSVHLFIVNDPSINAFVAEGQNMFLNTGLLMTLDTPNEIIGVMAHETGHMAHGDLIRAAAGIRAASIPLILSMAAGVGWSTPTRRPARLGVGRSRTPSTSSASAHSSIVRAIGPTWSIEGISGWQPSSLISPHEPL